MTKILEITTVGITARAFLVPFFQELKEAGYEVTYAATDDLDAREAAKQADVPFFPVYISRKISLKDFVAIYKLYKFIKKERFEIVHTHTAKAGFAGRFAASLAGVPYILHTAHGLTIHKGLSKFKKALYLFLERFIGKRTNKFICVTKLVQESLCQQGIASQEKCIVIPNFVGENYDHAKIKEEQIANFQKMLALPCDALLITAAARLVEDKGLEELIAAHSKLPENIFLAIAGDGPKKSELENLAKTYGSEKRLRLLGWVDNAMMPAFLSLSDIFVSATKREGFGVGIIEAQALGLPVVTSKIRPITDLIEENSAIFIDVSTPETTEKELFLALQKLIEDSAKRNELATKAKENAARYSLENYRKNVRAFLKNSLT